MTPPIESIVEIEVEPGQLWRRVSQGRVGLRPQLGEEVEIETVPFSVTFDSYPRGTSPQIEQVRGHYVSGPHEGEPWQWATSYLRSEFELESAE